MVKGEGSHVVYDDGRRMLDFTCGIGVTGLGGFRFLILFFLSGEGGKRRGGGEGLNVLHSDDPPRWNVRPAHSLDDGRTA